MLHAVEAAVRPRLDAYERSDGSVHIVDTRPCALGHEHFLRGLAARVYLACDEAKSCARLANELGEPASEVGTVLENLLAQKLMVHMEGRYLTLAVLRDRIVQPSTERRDVYIPISQAALANPLPSPA